MTDLLFEIGTEEIPARFMPKALADLAQYAAEELDGAHIAHGEIKSECSRSRTSPSVRTTPSKSRRDRSRPRPSTPTATRRRPRRALRAAAV